MASHNDIPPAASLGLDDLVRVFNDPAELSNYKFGKSGIPASAKTTRELFHMEVPYDKIKQIVEKEREAIFEHLDPIAPFKPVFEHVGSTSIKGMPGSLCPDCLLVEESFPPSRSTLNALLQAGFHFSSITPHDDADYWFFKDIPDGVLNGSNLSVVLHLVDKNNKMGKLLVRMRDVCNNDQAAFEDYKSSKLAAVGDGDVKLFSYKMKKGQCDLINRMREEVGLPHYKPPLNVMGERK